MGKKVDIREIKASAEPGSDLLVEPIRRTHAVVFRRRGSDLLATSACTWRSPFTYGVYGIMKGRPLERLEQVTCSNCLRSRAFREVFKREWLNRRDRQMFPTLPAQKHQHPKLRVEENVTSLEDAAKKGGFKLVQRLAWFPYIGLNEHAFLESLERDVVQYVIFPAEKGGLSVVEVEW